MRLGARGGGRLRVFLIGGSVMVTIILVSLDSLLSSTTLSFDLIRSFRVVHMTVRETRFVAGFLPIEVPFVR